MFFLTLGVSLQYRLVSVRIQASNKRVHRLKVCFCFVLHKDQEEKKLLEVLIEDRKGRGTQSDWIGILVVAHAVSKDGGIIKNEEQLNIIVY